MTAHGTVQWSNVTPPAPSGGAGGSLHLTAFATGGIVRPRPGGVPAILAEAGTPEAVIPLTNEVLSKLGSGGGTTTNNWNITEVTDPVGTANAVMRRLNALGRV